MRPLFVFDMDDVLYDYDFRVRMAALTRLTGHDLAELRRRWWHDGGEWRAEAGGYPDGASYLAAANAALGTDIPRDDWLRIRASAMTVRPAAIAAVERAAEAGRVTLLTNNGPLIDEHLADVAPALLPVFGCEHLRTSSRYGARKPDPAVFRRVLDAYGTPPELAFFADDLPENVAGARSLGITAHLVRDDAGLRAAVDDFAARF